MSSPAEGREILLSADQEGVFRLWDARTGRPISTWFGEQVELVKVVGHGFPGSVAAIQLGGVNFFDAPGTSRREPRRSNWAGWVAEMLQVEGGPQLAIGNTGGEIEFLPMGDVLEAGEKSTVTALASGVAGDGDCVVAGYESGTVRVFWNAPRSEPAEVLTGLTGPVKAVQVVDWRDGRAAVVAFGDDPLAWDPLTGARLELKELAGKVSGRLLALIRDSGIVGALDGPWDVSQEGVIAIPMEAGSIRLFRDGQPVRAPLIGHQAPVVDLSFGFLDAASPLLLDEAWVAPPDLEKPDSAPSAAQMAAGTQSVADVVPPEATKPSADEIVQEPEPAVETPAVDTASQPPSPARPAAGYWPDRVVLGKDFVDHLSLEDEVNALCSIVAGADVPPPISIGLFGDWGSGKSTFMSMMQRRVDVLARRAGAAEKAGELTTYCAEVCQIQFNAWHFVDANLWASIVTQIFERLADHYGHKGTGVWDEVLKDTATANEQLEEARRVAEQAEADRKATEERIAQLQQAVKDKNDEIAQKAEGRLSTGDLRRVAFGDERIRAQVQKAAGQLGVGGRSLGNLEELDEAVQTARTFGGRLRAIWHQVGGQRLSTAGRIGVLALLAALAALPALIAFALASPLAEQIRLLLSGASALIALGLEKALVAKPWIKAADDGISRLEQALEQLEDQALGALRRQRSRLEQELAQKKHDLKEAKRRVAEAESRKADAEQRRQDVRTGRYLADVMRERAGQPGYGDHLGIIDLIRRDFEGLSNLLAPGAGAARTRGRSEKRLDRIILYVDDLDRCPTDRVVDVLQAVHLLLAFPLFVVVVGVDSRWLLHSLSREYSPFETSRGSGSGKQAGEWTTTPQNYLEKIFQIPFTLRPMGEPGFKNLIDVLTEPQPPGTGSGTGGVEKASAERSGESATGVDQRGESLAKRAAPEPPESQGEAVEEEPSPEAEAQREREGPSKVMASVQAAEPGESPGPATTGGEKSARGARVDRAAGSDEPPDLTIDPAPPQLTLTGGEKEWMKRLDDLIVTPRATKRFVNTYRLIRAMVPDGELDNFVGTPDAPGEYRVVLLMLAMQSGFPDQAYDVFRWLPSHRTDSFSELVEGLKPLQSGTGWSNRLVGEEIIGAVEVSSWLRLHHALDELAPVLGFDDLEVFARHAGTVARFGFVTGRALSARTHAPHSSRPKAGAP